MIEQPTQGTYEVLQDAKRTLEEEGKLLAKAYNAPEIFELKAKKTFSRTWNFLVLETEVPWCRYLDAVRRLECGDVRCSNRGRASR